MLGADSQTLGKCGQDASPGSGWRNDPLARRCRHQVDRRGLPGHEAHEAKAVNMT